MTVRDGKDGIGFGLLTITQPFTGPREARSLLDLARSIDSRGFDTLFVVDHVHLASDRYLAPERDLDRPYQLEAYTTLAAVAAVTDRLRVGPLVTPLPLRHPVIVAKMATTIDVLSNGRMMLALGTGWKGPEYTTYGLPYDASFSRRFEQLIEGVELIKALWTTDGPVTYRGKHYTLEDARFYPKPVQSPPPIWFGGAGPSALDAVARIGDGWTPAAPHYDAVTPEAYARGWNSILERARNYGRPTNAITPALLVNTSIAERRDDALEAAEAQRLRDDWKDTTIDQMRESGVLAVGDPDDIVEHLERYYAAGVRFFTVCPVPFTMVAAHAAARLYVERVIPELRRRHEVPLGSTVQLGDGHVDQTLAGV